jgi:hypothetical protein
MIIVSVFLSTVVGLIRSFSLSYYMYVGLEFLNTVVGSGVYSGAFILGKSVFDPNASPNSTTSSSRIGRLEKTKHGQQYHMFCFYHRSHPSGSCGLGVAFLAIYVANYVRTRSAGDCALVVHTRVGAVVDFQK